MKKLLFLFLACLTFATVGKAQTLKGKYTFSHVAKSKQGDEAQLARVFKESGAIFLDSEASFMFPKGDGFSTHYPMKYTWNNKTKALTLDWSNYKDTNSSPQLFLLTSLYKARINEKKELELSFGTENAQGDEMYFVLIFNEL